MTCTQCHERPVFTTKTNLCRHCHCKKAGAKSWTREKTARSQRRQAILSRQEQDNRDMLNALQGAQKALRTLQRKNPDIDYSGALAQCQERIAELQTQEVTA